MPPLRGRRGPRPVPVVPITAQPPFSPALVRRRRHWARVWLTRLVVVAAAGLAAAALYTLVVRPLLPETEATPAPTPIERPETIPARVPGWAWELHLWHVKPAAERGPRPEGAPATVPAWYWDFRRWRLSLAPPD